MAFAGSKRWNEIPKEIKIARTLHSFQEHLNKHLATHSRHSHHDSLVHESGDPERDLVLSGSGFH